jgi:hypothetical protein
MVSILTDRPAISYPEIGRPPAGLTQLRIEEMNDLMPAVRKGSDS